MHKLRNLNKHIRYKLKHRRKMMRQVRTIYNSKNKRQAIKCFKKFCACWQRYEPHAVKCFQDGFFDTLNYFDFAEDKNLISSTNHIERNLEEVRRRIKIQGYFKSSRSANLWTYGIISQFKQEQQPEVMPKHIVTFLRTPQYESVQLS